MNYKKMQDVLRTCICIAGGFLIVCLIIQLLYRYIQHGEQEKQAFGDLETEMNLTKFAAETAKEAEAAKESVESTDKAETAEESIPHIRVQLLTQDYESKYHKEISVTSDSPYQVIFFSKDEDGNLVEVQQKEYMAGEVFAAKAEEEKKADEKTEDESSAVEICISVKEQNSASLRITSFTRADGCPEYKGTLHLYREEKGFILVNELPLEEYLYSVVSSEIPSGYPIEAQKAQAVCARTYARKCMERVQENNAVADLDDSVSWQVYNNYRSSEISRAAVDATSGEVLDVEDALYYSTSCLSEHRNDLDSDEKFAAFLDSMPDEDAEYGSPWIRWNVGIDHQTILEQLKLKYDCTAEQIDKIEVAERAGDGQVQKLRIVCGEQTIDVEGEYQIRNILSVKNSGIHLSDGSTVERMRMLPSAYFVLGKSNWTESETETLVNSEKVVYISGGGYGHGTGMSQCGAAAMAKDGADYKEILQYYYESDLTILSQEK